MKNKNTATDIMPDIPKMPKSVAEIRQQQWNTTHITKFYVEKLDARMENAESTNANQDSAIKISKRWGQFASAILVILVFGIVYFHSGLEAATIVGGLNLLVGLIAKARGFL